MSFLIISRCICPSIFNNDGTRRNAIITSWAWDWSENENGLFWSLESSTSIIRRNWTWFNCGCHDCRLLLQCHYSLVSLLPLQIISGMRSYYFLSYKVRTGCFKLSDKPTLKAHYSTFEWTDTDYYAHFRKLGINILIVY